MAHPVRKFEDNPATNSNASWKSGGTLLGTGTYNVTNPGGQAMGSIVLQLDPNSQTEQLNNTASFTPANGTSITANVSWDGTNLSWSFGQGVSHTTYDGGGCTQVGNQSTDPIVPTKFQYTPRGPRETSAGAWTATQNTGSK